MLLKKPLPLNFALLQVENFIEFNGFLLKPCDTRLEVRYFIVTHHFAILLSLSVFQESEFLPYFVHLTLVSIYEILLVVR